MKPILLRRIFLAALVALSGCAVFDSTFHPTSAGISTTADPAFVSFALEHERQAAAMHDAICAAGADTAECRK